MTGSARAAGLAFAALALLGAVDLPVGGPAAWSGWAPGAVAVAGQTTTAMTADRRGAAGIRAAAATDIGAAGIRPGPATGPPVAARTDHGQLVRVADTSPATLEIVGRARQYWYTGRQLRRPLRVELSDESAETCGRRQVVFDAGADGQVSPAAARPRWIEGSCRAEAWWRLGPTVGVQHAVAHLDGGSDVAAVTFQAIARQGARIFFGGAYTPREEGWVELVESEDGSEPARLQEVEPTGYFRPIVGVDFPLWPEWQRIRVAVGASAREIDRFFFFGLSALQGLVFGPGQEGSAVDVHAGIQLSRRDVGVAGEPCAPDPICSRRELRFSGLTFMVSIDGASAFRGLAGAVLR